MDKIGIISILYISLGVFTIYVNDKDEKPVYQETVRTPCCRNFKLNGVSYRLRLDKYGFPHMLVEHRKKFEYCLCI